MVPSRLSTQPCIEDLLEQEIEHIERIRSLWLDAQICIESSKTPDEALLRSQEVDTEFQKIQELERQCAQSASSSKERTRELREKLTESLSALSQSHKRLIEVVRTTQAQVGNELRRIRSNRSSIHGYQPDSPVLPVHRQWQG